MPSSQIFKEALRDAPLRRELSAALLARAADGVISVLPYVLVYFVLARALLGALTVNFVAAVTLALLATFSARYYLFQWSSERIYRSVYGFTGSLRIKVADHLRKLSLESFSGEKLEATKSILTDDLTTVASMLASILGFMVTGVMIPLTILSIISIVDWRLGLALASSAVIAAPMCYVLLRYIGKHSACVHSKNARASSKLLEFVQGIPTLRSLGLAGSTCHSLNQALDEAHQTQRRLEIDSIVLSVLAFIAIESGFAVVLLVGTNLALDSQLSIAALLLSLVLATRFYAPVQDLLALVSEFKFLSAAFERVESVLQQATLEPQRPTAEIPRDASVVFSNVSFQYGSRPALREISFEALPGTTTALVGTSGAGKSTIFSLLARFWDFNRGAIRIGGVDIRDMSLEQVGRLMSVVFQDAFLFSGSILDNIRIASPNAPFESVVAAAKRARCHDFIQNLPDGYQTEVCESGGKLSGGEKQRIAIARAILKDAPILLLDEATASIDSETQVEFELALRELSKGKTVLVIAHRLSTIAGADQTLVFQNGEIVQRGKHSTLLAQSGLYQQLWRTTTIESARPSPILQAAV
ncbi:MAG: ABC transporter ATP-binding protein [Deltaproteobacteria bacterium]|nr:ABC transporter ATP-binding protein [Deltaproteobacteria bacterium]